MTKLDLERKHGVHASRHSITGAREIPTVTKSVRHATTKRSASRRAPPAFPIGGPNAESAALQVYAGDSCDDRVSEDIFDVENEYAEVAIIVQKLNRGLH